MRIATTLALVLASFPAHHALAQFIALDEGFQPTGLSNAGLVAGYSAQTGPYRIWNPDLLTVDDIGGLAPGSGIGGQAQFSYDGNFLSGTSLGTQGAELSRYDGSTGEWTLFGSLGFPVDNTVSGGYSISGDGTTVVGNSWADTTGNLAYSHAVACNAIDGVMDLGTLFFGRSTRANAVSEDASVVVGWQDFNGPWKSAVWRKNPNGGYFPNEYLLLDASGDPTDEFNQLGECSAVSADGAWIGGYGDYANNGEPWIWSAGTGVINLGHLPFTGNGFVGGMTADASIVVGWFDGELFGDPQTPFIWTAADGLQNLNTYITDVLGFDLGSRQPYTANCISPDGRYIAGYGVDNTLFELFTYRVDLDMTSGVMEAAGANSIKAYPNPTSGIVSINVPERSSLSILSADGSVLLRTSVVGNSTLDLSNYAPGVYTLSLLSGGSLRTQRITKY
ncbi:MAG: T9SS type A sorting domain-containing protein [Flavobacteriales bacterium]